ncbi:S8 family serine peptidase [candidate division KSB1 bacterium]|nr:S8 family serine peptidase [candidate division KSB1 bacterium]
MMASLLALGLSFVLDTTPAAAKAGQNVTAKGAGKKPSWNYLPGRVIVKFKPSVKNIATSAEMNAIRSAHNVASAKPLFPNATNKLRAEKHSIGLSRVFLLEVDTNADIERVVAALRRDPAVEYAEPDYIMPLDVMPQAPQQAALSNSVAAAPNDPSYAQQQHLPQIKAPQAWEIAKGDSNVVVAIIDSGTDWDHPDLAANIWRNHDEVIDGVDNDNNGFIDDIRGWDFVDDRTDAAPGEDGDEPDNNPMDFGGHGTHTAGLAAAHTNNGVGVAAISWNVKIMPLRAGWQSTSSGGLLLSSWTAKAFVYAADNGAHVANLSAASTYIVADAARYAFENGVVITVSAGNDNDEFAHPLDRAPFAISVAALDDLDRKASYSTYGDWVKVSAPGGDMNRSRPDILSTMFDNRYIRFHGTSMAAPLVAGVAALVKSIHPDWPASQVTFQVVETADNIDAFNPSYAGKLGAGRINAYRALTETVTPMPRLSYLDATIADRTGGNSNNKLDAGETANLIVRVQNVWGEATNLSATLTTDDWAVTVTKGVANYGAVPGLSNLNNNIGSNAADPFVVQVSSAAHPHRAHFTLSLTGDNDYHKTFDFFLGINPSILLVDDDDAGFNDVEEFYLEAFDQLGVAPEYHDHAISGNPDFAKMKNYATVVWLCEWAEPALDALDRAELAKFLEAGGNLFISGQDLGWGLCDSTGIQNEFDFSSGASKIFYETYLHARYLKDDSDFSSLTGVAGDPISDGLKFEIFQPGRGPHEQFPSEIMPHGSAQSIFNYPNGASGAVRFAGDYRVVHFAFGGYEAIVETPVRETVMERALNWLNGVAIEHTPLRDTEDTTHARTVTAQITSTLSPLMAVDLYWDTDGAFPFNRVDMIKQGDNYSAEIPPQSRGTVEYFIVARTEKGFTSPAQKHAYTSQPDRTPPVLALLSELPNTIHNAGNFSLEVEVTDMLGVDTSSVWIHFRSASHAADSARLFQTLTPGRFEGSFSAKFAFGDTVFYSVSARDLATAHNRGLSDEKNFMVGFEDFEHGLNDWQVEPEGWGLAQNRRLSGLYSVSSNPGKNYGANVNTSLTLASPLDLSRFSNAAISFMEQHYFAANQEDFGIVEISTDNGQSWAPLSEQFRGTQNQWRARQYSLNAYAGAGFTDVRVRFRIQSDATGTPALPGWFVEDVKIASSGVSVQEHAETQALPQQFALLQSYPNPFRGEARSSAQGVGNPETTIKYQLPNRAQVELVVYDLTGRRVGTLEFGFKAAGEHMVRWNGRDSAGNRVPSGIYFYRLEATSPAGTATTLTRKMTVMN